MKCGKLPKLALLSFTCYNNSHRGREFNRDRRRRHLLGGSRPLNFDNIYKSSFLPALTSLDLNGTFVWADGGGVIPFRQCLSRHCLGYLSSTLSDRRKIQGHPGSNGFPKNLTSVP